MKIRNLVTVFINNYTNVVSKHVVTVRSEVEIFKTLKYKIKTTSKQSTMKRMIVLAAISSIFLIVLPLASLADAATGEKEYIKIRN